MRRPTWCAISFRGVECIFVRQAEQLGLGRGLCAERAVGGDPFAVLLADAIRITNPV